MASSLNFYILNSSENSMPKGLRICLWKVSYLFPLKGNSFAFFLFRIPANCPAPAHGENIQLW